MTRSFKRGDHVYVGTPTAGKVHWEVEYVDSVGLVHLSSPMSGRRTTALPHELTFHSEGVPS